MKTIPLTDGRLSKVDDELYEALRIFKWYPAGYKNKYANAYVPEQRRTVFMQELVIGKPPTGKQSHHINGDTLDNQRKNLQHVSYKENSRRTGRKTCRSKQTSSYKGVAWIPNSGKWRAAISGDPAKGQKITVVLGYFDNEIAAAECYDDAAFHKYGFGAHFNFLNRVVDNYNKQVQF